MAPRKRTTTTTPATSAPTSAGTPRKRTPKKATAAEVATEQGRLDRRAATLAIRNKLNRATRSDKYGPGTVVSAAEVVVPTRMPTGSPAFDVAMSGGFPVNQWSEVVGLENAGKTTVILKALAKSQQQDADYTCLWIASESYDPKLAAMCGVDNERVELVEENVMEVAFDIALQYIEGRGCDMVVIDSYPAMVTQLEDGKNMDEVTMGGAKVLNLFMRKCTKASKRSLTNPDDDRPFTGVLVNQWREKIGVMHGDPRTTSGGKGKNYWMYARLDVKRDEWITNSAKEKVGQVIKIVCFKMKGARPQQVGVTDFYFAEHGEFKPGDYDEFKGLVNLGLLFDIIGRRGSGYVDLDGVFYKSQADLVEALRADTGQRTRLEAELVAFSKRGKAPIEVEDETRVLELVADTAAVDDAELLSVRPRKRRKTV